MSKQLCYEDVEVGTELPTLVKHPTTRQLVMWAGATGDYYELHYDKDFAQNAGFPGVIVHGRLKASFLTQLMTDWIGDEGFLKKFSCRYRGVDYPCQEIKCKGKVTKKYIENGEHLVECEIWTEDPQGEKTTPATAVAILPSRS